ncbi:hypothetical protein [Desulfococcus sp.]|uniref:hypothetical protein n=1 Tax=Desulfococcus sp. TaxID=2025834 RepID=UPI003593E8AB
MPRLWRRGSVSPISGGSPSTASVTGLPSRPAQPPGVMSWALIPKRPSPDRHLEHAIRLVQPDPGDGQKGRARAWGY